MERYSVRANYNGTLSSMLTSQISMPPKPHIPSYLSRQHDYKDTEISIFDAERYFNELGETNTNNYNKKNIRTVDSYCDSSTNPRDSSVSSVVSWRNRSFRATPTVSSEASWNSQSGLLANAPGFVPVSVRTFEKRKNCRRFFGRNCPCYGKKSVDVEEKYAETKSSVRSSITGASVATSVAEHAEGVAKLKISAGVWAKDPATSYPPVIGRRVVNSGSAGFSFPVLARPPAEVAVDDDPARESLEVFRPNDEFARRPVAGVPTVAGDDDVASDTSSDLFEIESFSTGSAVYRRRDSLDEFPKLAGNAGMMQLQRSLEETAASISRSECYAPSEVSVEWSVTTAEGGFDRTSVANFSSAASDCEEVRFVQAENDRFNRKKGGTGGLLSCRCENSVNVGPSPVRIGTDQRRAVPAVFAVEPVDQGTSMGVSRFALEKTELVRRQSAQLNRPVQTR